MRAVIETRAPGLPAEEVTALARVAAGRLDRAERLLDPAAASRRQALVEVARSVYLDPAFEPAAAAERLLAGVDERGAAAARTVPRRPRSARAARARGGAARPSARGSRRRAEELLASLDELAAWYRDLVVVVGRRARPRPSTATGSTSCARTRSASGRSAPSARRQRCARLWRELEEFNLNAGARARGAVRPPAPRARRPCRRGRMSTPAPSAGRLPPRESDNVLFQLFRTQHALRPHMARVVEGTGVSADEYGVLGVVGFLRPDHAHRPRAEARPAAHDRLGLCGAVPRARPRPPATQPCGRALVLARGHGAGSRRRAGHRPAPPRARGSTWRGERAAAAGAVRRAGGARGSRTVPRS